MYSANIVKCVLHIGAALDWLEPEANLAINTPFPPTHHHCIPLLSIVMGRDGMRRWHPS